MAQPCTQDGSRWSHKFTNGHNELSGVVAVIAMSKTQDESEKHDGKLLVLPAKKTTTKL